MLSYRMALLLVGSTSATLATETPPPWAYGFTSPPPANVASIDAVALITAQAKQSELPVLRLPGTERQFTPAQIRNNYGPADWYPNDHPTMPAIVAQGRSPLVWACARCHYPNGKGRPENAPIAGLPVDYFVEQLQAFRRGDRHSSDPRKANTPMMTSFAQAMTDDEIHAAANYYGAMKWTPWIRVVEAERAPKTTLSAGMFLQIDNGGDESLANRIIEVPEDPQAVEALRSPRVGFIAYVPIGSVQRGEMLVTTGGLGKTLTCAACHGADFGGLVLPDIGKTPGLAGRSPSYLVRQLFDLQSGARRGGRAELMKPVVANLSTDDMLAIAAYLASRAP